MNEYTIPFRETEDDVIDNILRRIRLTSHDLFMDIGCGNGIVLEKVAKQFPAVPCIGIEIDPSFVSAANKRLEAYENVTIYNKDLRNMEWSELPVVEGIVYCFIAWTNKYLEQFDFQQLGETIVWISFKHEIPRKSFTEKLVSNYPYNTVYIYQPVARAL